MNDNKQYILDNLDKALQEEWITAYYQPIIRAVNGRVCDEEALARWIDPVKGFLSPADFIPVLEEEKLIYKVDLHILDCVLEKMKYMVNTGHFMCSHSINLSRSDFDMCDMVQEIVTRVDKSGIPRDKINIEITESTLVNDFKFMLSQIEKFKRLGFSVWMDDFGSGYSSLNTLASLEGGGITKAILPELTSIGNETFSGCSRLQGYYYCKPVSLEQILERYKTGTQIGFENPAESAYSQQIGEVNLHDLSILNQNDNKGFSNFFNTLPMAIMEIDSDMVRYVRANKAYSDFMEKYFFMKQDRSEVPIKMIMQGPGAAFMLVLKQAAKEGKPMFVDEKLPEGSKAHYYISKITENPVTKRTAIVVAVLSVRDAETGETYANIARALAMDYFNLFYVNLETEEYIEYTSNVGEDEIATEKPGVNFFKVVRMAAPGSLHEEDVDVFLEAFNKENITKVLDEQGTFVLTYRILKYGMPYYVSMKVMRMQNDNKHIIIGVSNVDTQMREKAQLEQAKQDKLVYSRLMALAGDYICIYVIDLKTNSYVQHQATAEFEQLGIQTQGKDFFADTQVNADKAVIEEDREQFKRYHTKDNILAAIEKDGVFKSRHHLLINGELVFVSNRCVLTKENGEDKLIMGIRKV